MSHARQQIRDAIESAITGLKTTEQNVFTSKFYRLKTNDLPALRFKTSEEETTLLCKTPRYIMHTLPVQIECIAKACDDVDNIIDTIAGEVETAITNDSALQALTKGVIYQTKSTIEYYTEQEQPLGKAIVTFIVKYLTINGLPEVAQ